MLLPVLCTAILLTGGSHETKIEWKALPAAVQQAALAELKGDQVRGVSREIEDGKTFYEVESKRAGKTRDILFDPEGHLVELEEELAVTDVPAPVAATMGKYGKVDMIERVTKGGVTTYEGHVRKNGKEVEVKTDAAGQEIKN